MKITSCAFERSAFREQDEPTPPGPALIFLGRSNVGKSSLINRLLGVKGLARTSSTPGRTQSVNFYRVNDALRFVDLPGYGYARVPKEVREAWRPMVDGFLERWHDSIVLALLVVDSRHEPTALDRTMRDWIEDREIPCLVTVTKSDKLSGNGRAKALQTMKKKMKAATAVSEPILTSAENGMGMREVWRHIDQAIATSGQG